MGIEIGIGWLTLLMFGSLVILLMAGLPLAFVTGGLACIFLFVFGDARMLNILPSRIFPFMTDYQLSAIPLFIFMAAMLERAGLIFAMDAIEVNESTLNEWGIHYWPVKLAIPIGALLLLLQGTAKLMRDVIYLRGLSGARGA